jgi:four helix bundle protein
MVLDWSEEEVDVYLVGEEGRPYDIKERSFLFSKDVVEWIRGLDQDYKFRSLFDQLLRSATSIGANLVEGTAGQSKKDWLKFLHISLKSANETGYWLRLIHETLEGDDKRLSELRSEVDEIAKIIAKIIINASR